MVSSNITDTNYPHDRWKHCAMQFTVVIATPQHSGLFKEVKRNWVKLMLGWVTIDGLAAQNGGQ